MIVLFVGYDIKNMGGKWGADTNDGLGGTWFRVNSKLPSLLHVKIALTNVVCYSSVNVVK